MAVTFAADAQAVNHGIDALHAARDIAWRRRAAAQHKQTWMSQLQLAGIAHQGDHFVPLSQRAFENEPAGQAGATKDSYACHRGHCRSTDGRQSSSRVRASGGGRLLTVLERVGNRGVMA